MALQECVVQSMDAHQRLQWEIARRRQAEQALLESEERYRRLYETAPSGIGILDQAGNIMTINPNMTKMSGYALEELQILGIYALYPDPKLRQELFGILSGSGRMQYREVRLNRKDGAEYDAVLNAEQIELEGRKALLIDARDITEHKRMEEQLRKSELKYRTLVEHSLQGLAILQDTRIVFCNKAYAKIYGYSVEELLSFSPQEFIALTHPEDQALVLGQISDGLAGKPVPSRYEYRGIKKDGTVCWLEVFASLAEYEGRPAMQAFFIDITERKRVMTALRESEERFRLITETMNEVFWVFDVQNDKVLAGC